ncbi:inositol monophosphatase family protein [Leucobacter sp. GX24907]
MTQPGISSPDLTTADLESLTAIAADAARAVGDRIKELRDGGVEVAATKSSSTDIVTTADRESERLLVEAISAARPDDAFFGEEGTGTTGTSGITWVLDPIDGTVNYLYGIPAYVVSVAATVADPHAFADGRRAVAGAVYNPSTGELFTAYQGGGSRLNGSIIAITGHGDLGTALVATGFGYSVERRTEQAEVVAKLIPQVRDIRRIGSCAYDLCMVACGRLDAYYERGVQPWDYAAGALIASEAGAALLGKDDATPPGEPLFVAAAPSLVGELRAALQA